MPKLISKDLYRISFTLKKEFHRRVFTAVFNFILIFVIINLILSFIAFPVKERSDSMGPDIAKNSLIFVSPLNLPVKRGEVYLVDKNSPVNTVGKKILNAAIRFFTFQKRGLEKNTENLSSRMCLRRVIGLPGDTVYMKNFVIYVKSAGEKYFLTEFELSEKKYNIDIEKLPDNWDTLVGFRGSFTPITLGPGQYFVIADNRLSSLDSRLWGVVNKKDLVAKTIALYYPVKRARIF